MSTQKPNIRKWVDSEPSQRVFRQAVHTILTAISGTSDLQTSMIMKGGILLALGYESPRFTKDIDFSTASLLQDFDLQTFSQRMESSLINAVESLGYGLDCRMQSCKQEPPRPDATFPSIHISIGYAYKHDTSAHKRLQAKNSPSVVRLDYSLNEPIGSPEFMELDGGERILTYSLQELVAEKFRALLQQEQRNRIRRQDIYDLNYIMQTHPLIHDDAIKQEILLNLIRKAQARDLAVSKDSMANPEIIRRTRADYPSLADEIEGVLPPFDELYAAVEEFYRSLPWE